MKIVSSVVALAALATTTQAEQPDACKTDADPASCYQARCLGAFEASGYTALATSDYSKWFNGDSVLEYVGAGVYTGIEGIAEYINLFVTPLLFESTVRLDTKDPVAISSAYNQCVVIVADQEGAKLDGEGALEVGIPPLTTGSTVETVRGQKIQFQVRGEDDDTILIKRIDLYLPKGYASVLISQAEITNLLGFFCQAIMFGACNDVWNANFPNNPTYPTNSAGNPCFAALTLIPPFEGENENTNIDGNSIGCRILHGSFAIDNPFHCPHISFDPMMDEKGDIKCQQTSGLALEDRFTTNELEYMYAAAVDFDLDAEPIPGIKVTTLP